MVRGSPCMCISTTSQPSSAAASAAPGARSALTSFHMPAPAATAARATSGFMVSMESAASVSASSRRTTGSTRASSTSAGTGCAPGRVDSPPMSSEAAPWATSAMAWATAASGSAWRPPSEKLSGVTLTTPITRGGGRPLLTLGWDSEGRRSTRPG